MYFNFVYDKFQNQTPYPNLASEVDISNGYGNLWNQFPYTIPTRLLYYFQNHDYPARFFHIDNQLPSCSWYPIALGFYDFSIDYFALLNDQVKNLVREQKLRILFYYHEGDNPYRQLEDLNQKCTQNKLPLSYKFITGNTAAENIERFIYFPDHELFYWKANRQHAPLPCSMEIRKYDFTALVRTHKWWRATIMADLHRNGLLNNSMWSYGVEQTDDNFLDNPIEIDSLPGLRTYLSKFMHHTPYRCDDLDSTKHNTHHILVPEHFQDSYIHIVVETFFDVDQSNGTFLTEKVFKPIKHGQPFILVGPAGGLNQLRKLGYNTFDNIIDPTYDTITNNTHRWMYIQDLIKKLKKQNLQELFEQCQADILHNQLHFVSSKYNRLKKLQEQLNAS